MLRKLHFNLSLKTHPYPEDSGANLEAWSEIRLYVRHETEQIILTEIEWDIIPLAEWFAQVKSNLLEESLSIIDPITGNKCEPYPSESLSQALDRFYERDFSEEEDMAEFEWSTQLYEFRQRHCLRFAFRGSIMKDIIIGCNKGTGEISIRHEDNKWMYRFDMGDFCEDLERKLVRILNEQLDNTNDRQFISRLTDTLQMLNHVK